MRRDRVKNIFIRIFLWLLALFPLLLGAISAFIYFFNYPSNKLFAFIITLIIFMGLMLLLASKLQIEKHDSLILVSLFFLTIILRYISQNLIDTQPTADYLNALKIAEKFAEGFYPEVRSARFPYWGFYKLTLSLFLNVFDHPFDFTKYLNLVLSGITTIGVYFLGKASSGTRKLALASAIIYIFFPGDILYKNMPTGEHIFIMLLPFAVLLFNYSLNEREGNWIKLLLFTFLGGLLGLMDLYRPVALILLIAFMLSIVFFKILATQQDKHFFKNRHFWQNLLMILLIFIGFFSVKAIGFYALRKKTGYEPNRSGIGWTLRIGLDVQNGGIWNRATYDQMIALYEKYEENYQEVNHILFKDTKEILKENRSEIFGFFVQKFSTTWKSTYDFFHWATVARSENGIISSSTEKLGTIILPLLDMYWLFILIFSCIGAVYCAEYQRGIIPFLLGLFIIGLGMMLLITETQQRYLSVLHSSLPIMTSYGLLGFSKLMKDLFNHIRSL